MLLAGLALAGLRSKSAVGAPEDFCFPPLSSVTIRVNNGETNSSLLLTESIWTAPSALRATLTVSPTPFGADAPAPYPVNILNDEATRTSWQWYTYPGAGVICDKRAMDATDSTSVCVGGDLSLNSTRVVGGRPANAWVGFSDDPARDGACWHELLVASAESADPAAWVSLTSQCVKASGNHVQNMEFSDFSNAPFDPAVFQLPKECK